jgi:putative exporter of polyketide antibiotics
MQPVVTIDKLVKSFAPSGPSTGSTSSCAQVRCTASSAPTDPGSRPPSGSCSDCCGPTPAGSGSSGATRGGTAAAYGAVVAGLMSMLLVGRHTRQEEETGRGELVRAGSVGALAPTASAVLVALAANVALGPLVVLGLVGYGLSVSGSLALGLALATTGWVFTAVTVVAVQATVTTRATYALTGAVIWGRVLPPGCR